jgi:ADP-ribosyl-[dinitrogen reductase] hydrolase
MNSNPPAPNTPSRFANALVGCILGTAVGDALGLPYEGLSPQRRAKLFAPLAKYHFWFGKGMVTDNTEQTIMVAKALSVAGSEPREFAHHLARHFKWWLLGLPLGIGMATFRSILRLWCGYPPDRSGVKSASNGAVTRSAIIGVCYGNTPDLMRNMVLAATRVTHRGPQAEYGGVAVALAAYLSTQHQFIKPEQYYQQLYQLIPVDNAHAARFFQSIEAVAVSVNSGVSTVEFAQRQGWHRGISGNLNDTVAISIHAWLSHQHNYHSAVLAAIECGGSTDTTGAIVGAIVGARVGWLGIPDAWIYGLSEFPYDVKSMEAIGYGLATAVESGTIQPLEPVPFHLLLFRNLIFVSGILTHRFRRLIS